MTLSSREQIKLHPKTSGKNQKRRRVDASRIGVKSRELDTAKREAALVEGDAMLAQQEVIVAAMLEIKEALLQRVGC